MAEIRITAMYNANGPSLPSRLSARLGERSWPGGGTVPVLLLQLGPDSIEVWPADSEYIRSLGEKLVELAGVLS